jgi:hypothetical protein
LLLVFGEGTRVELGAALAVEAAVEALEFAEDAVFVKAVLAGLGHLKL